MKLDVCSVEHSEDKMLKEISKIAPTCVLIPRSIEKSTALSLAINFDDLENRIGDANPNIQSSILAEYLAIFMPSPD